MNLILMRIRIWVLFIIGTIFVFGSDMAIAQENFIEHTYKKNESLWFLAELYYGKHEDFQKILKANPKLSPEKVREGMKIKIPDIRFSPAETSFQARYEELMKKKLNRKEFLQTKKTSVNPQKIPDQKLGVFPLKKANFKKNHSETLKRVAQDELNSN